MRFGSHAYFFAYARPRAIQIYMQHVSLASKLTIEKFKKVIFHFLAFFDFDPTLTMESKYSKKKKNYKNCFLGG
jgi:hypothetical protein